jgi:methionine synthase / methylenetetrahydrofolate reductase(NADPH)
VQEIHRAYIAAGAEIIETNTFGANRFRLAAHGLEDRVRDINLRGAKIAREAREIGGLPVFVAGSVGPIGRPLAPLGVATPDDAESAFREQVLALLEGGVDLLMLETFSDIEEIRRAVLAAKAVCDLPIVAQMSFNDEAETPTGARPEDVTVELERLAVDVIGANCCVGPAATLSVLQRMRISAKGSLSVQPNAGYPGYAGGRFVYFASPAYFADYAGQFVDSGATLIGSCCGTTPEHTAAMAAALRERGALAPQRTTVAVTHARPAAEERQAAPEAAGPSTVRAKLTNGRFVVSVEIDPPKGANPTKALQGAAYLKEVGVDCINIADSPMARVRMSGIGLAYLIQERVGLETIIHFTTRDRNLMGLQSDLLGAHAVGIRNVLALTGDPPRLGDYPSATAVFDVDSIGLITILKRMNEGKDWTGNAIGQGTTFLVACALDMQRCLDDAKEMERFRRKMDAGADFVMSQPIYDIAVLRQFLDRYGDAHGQIAVPHLLGVMPLQSSRHTEFLHNEVPGISIPDWARERMRAAGERGLQEGLEMAQELLAEAQQYVQGAYLMPSFGRYEIVGELVKALNKES